MEQLHSQSVALTQQQERHSEQLQYLQDSFQNQIDAYASRPASSSLRSDSEFCRSQDASAVEDQSQDSPHSFAPSGDLRQSLTAVESQLRAMEGSFKLAVRRSHESSAKLASKIDRLNNLGTQEVIIYIYVLLYDFYIYSSFDVKLTIGLGKVSGKCIDW